jgi:hypothetical protein
VAELNWIERHAKTPIVEAIECESEVELLEQGEDTIATAQATRRLVESLGRLNAVANIRRKGRDDLDADILESATETLLRCDRGDLGSMETCIPARTLACKIVESYEAMRKYLRDASKDLRRVDPHLCNNACLVARLADWEESWEMGGKYVRQTGIMASICDAVAEIRAVQRVAPELSAMIDNCDAELFLVLPRLLWLRFATASTAAAASAATEASNSSNSKKEEAASSALLRALLPHRFGGPAAVEAGRSEPCSELRAFLEQFTETVDLLAAGDNHPGAALAREALIKRAVVGGPGLSSDAGVCAGMRATEDLMRTLEGWSVELQRHCPEEWNQCSALLVQCVSGSGGRAAGPDAGDFVV